MSDFKFLMVHVFSFFSLNFFFKSRNGPTRILQFSLLTEGYSFCFVAQSPLHLVSACFLEQCASDGVDSPGF